MERKIAMVWHIPASMAPIARPMSASVDVHVEVEPDAEIGGHKVAEGRVPALVRHDAVHAGLVEPGVAHRVPHRLHRHGPGAAARVTAVLRLADPDDAVLVLESCHGALLDDDRVTTTGSGRPT